MPVGDPSPPTDDPLIGKVLSERYRILRKIGEGGMGAVYQAEHALIEKKIALKILFQDLTRRPDLVARFLQEASGLDLAQVAPMRGNPRAVLTNVGLGVAAVMEFHEHVREHLPFVDLDELRALPDLALCLLQASAEKRDLSGVIVPNG